MRRVLMAAAAAAVLAGCTTTTAYGPAMRPGAIGFAERPIESDRWRVSFRAGSDAPPELAQDFALRRAAELTLERGYDWFRVVDRTLEATPPTSPRFSVGLGGGGYSYGRRSASGVGVGVGTGFGGGAAPAASLEVLFGRGPAPLDPDVYDARGVIGAAVPDPLRRP